MIPIAFVVVLGAKALSDPALVDPKTMFITFAGEALGGALGSALNWIVAIMLIVALLLSALNAIMGSARGLHQMSVDGQFPRWFSHVNKHGVPDTSMLVNTAASLVVVCLGGAVQIYSFSNVGYIASFVPVIIGYYLLRKYKPTCADRSGCPKFFKYLALALAGLYVFFWIGGGITYSIIGNVTIYYILGWVTLLAYLPLYWWRHRVEDPKYAKAEAQRLGTLRSGDQGMNMPLSMIGRRRPAPPPDPATLEIRRVLIASDGRPIPRRVIEFAAELATSGRGRKASVHVFSVARIYGTSLGMPMPGLLPTRRSGTRSVSSWRTP